MGKTNYNTMRANMPKLSREFDNWENWVREDIPQLAEIPLRVRCTWTEAFLKPFRISELLTFSYDIFQVVELRTDAVNSLYEFFQSAFFRENMTSQQVIGDNIGNYIIGRTARMGAWYKNVNTRTPGIFRLQKEFRFTAGTLSLIDRIANFFGGNRTTDRTVRKQRFWRAQDFPIGKCTGRYYIDIFGFIWVEMWGNFQENERQLCWVRWLSIDQSRDNATLHNLLREKRAQIMQERAEHEHAQEVSDEKTKRNLTYLGAGALFLASSRLGG